MKQIARVSSYLLIGLGLLLLFGAAGNADYYNDVGAYMPLSQFWVPAGKGLALMLGGYVCTRVAN